MLSKLPVYSDTINYKINEICIIDGKFYKALVDNAGSPLVNTSNWKEISQKEQNIISTTTATLVKNTTNVIASSSAGVYTMPVMNDGEWIRILPTTTGHQINFDGTRLFWLANGTTTNSLTIAAGELSGIRLEAFPTNYIGGTI